MSGKPTAAGASESAGYQPASPAAIRNVVLVGPAGSGKTTLVEALLAATGQINRAGRVEDGTTVSDYDESEIRQQRSIGLSLAPTVVNDVKINLLDAPGYADFVGELRAGLRAADCALFVISANEGVDGATRALWDECESVGMPRCVVISKLNHQRADYASVLAAAQAAFGDKVIPLYVPVAHAGSDIDDLVALLSQTVSDYSSFASSGRQVRDPDDDEQALIDEYRGTLIEGIIEESEDEGLMDRYMGGEEIKFDLLVDDLETAVARGSFFPVIPVCAMSGLGLDELLEIITEGFPSPSEHTFPEVYTTAGKSVSGLVVRPGRRAAGRGGQDHVRPVRRPDQPGARLLRHCPARCHGARVRPLLRVLRRLSAATRTTTRTSASAPSRRPSARRCGWRPRASPATSARLRSCRGPRPATRSAARRTRW